MGRLSARRTAPRCGPISNRIYGEIPAGPLAETAQQGFAGQRLSGGEQQYAAIGRALMGPRQPLVLVRGEPSAGAWRPTIVEQTFPIIPPSAMRAPRCLLVEQTRCRASRMCEPRLFFLESGRRGAVGVRGADPDRERHGCCAARHLISARLCRAKRSLKRWGPRKPFAGTTGRSRRSWPSWVEGLDLDPLVFPDAGQYSLPARRASRHETGESFVWGAFFGPSEGNCCAPGIVAWVDLRKTARRSIGMGAEPAICVLSGGDRERADDLGRASLVSGPSRPKHHKALDHLTVDPLHPRRSWWPFTC